MREFEPDFDPIKIVEEMLATKDTGKDKQIPVSIAYRDATALAMFLRVPRSAAEVVFESDESERIGPRSAGEGRAQVVAFDHLLSGKGFVWRKNITEVQFF